MKKKILCLLLALCLCLSVLFVVSACSKPEEETPPAEENNNPPASEEQTPTTDESGKKGQIHYTEDTSAGVDVEDSGNENQIVDNNSTGRY